MIMEARLVRVLILKLGLVLSLSVVGLGIVLGLLTPPPAQAEVKPVVNKPPAQQIRPALVNTTSQFCTVYTVTQTSGDLHGEPAVSALDNFLLTFWSTAEEFGPDNPDRNPEIFLVEIIDEDYTTNVYTQVTKTGGNILGGFNFSPVLNESGTRLIFSSDIITDSNPDGNFEIFVAELSQTLTITPIINTAGFNAFPSISAEGEYIAFASDADLDPRGLNRDSNVEIFWADIRDLNNIIFTQVTSSTQGNQGGINTTPQISAEGEHIVFISDRDLSGDGGDTEDGNAEVFLAEINVTQPHLEKVPLTQITNTPASVEHQDPSVNKDGTVVAFTEINTQSKVVLYQIAQGITSTQPISDNANITHQQPAVNENGKFIAFIASPVNSETEEVYLYVELESAPAQYIPLSDDLAGTGKSFEPAISTAGNRVTFISNRSGNDEIYVVECDFADIEVIKSADPITGVAGALLTYTVAVRNNGPADASSVSLTDTLPLITSSPVYTIIKFTPEAPSCKLTAGQITCDFGGIKRDETKYLTLTLTLDPEEKGTLTNTATMTTTISDLYEGNNSDILTTSIIKVADLDITKIPKPSPAIAGNPLTYTLYITNLGPSNASGIILTDTLPDEVNYIIATTASGICSDAEQTITCNWDNIPRQHAVTATIGVSVASSAVDTLENKASATSGEEDFVTANSDITQITPVIRNVALEVLKSADPNPAIAGEPLTYTLTVINKGPSDTNDVVLIDTLPNTDVTFSQAFTQSGNCIEDGGQVTCTWDALSAKGGLNTHTATIVLMVDPAAQNNIINMAQVTSQDDTSPGQADTSTPVEQEVYLDIVKVGSSDPVVAGTPVTYTLHITNKGPSVARNVVLTDTFPDDTSYVDSTPGNSLSQSYFWSFAPLTVTEHASVTLTLLVDSAVTETLTNLIEATGIGVEPFPTTSTLTTAITTEADLAVSKAVSASQSEPPVAGELITYSITITNHGPSDARQVTFNDIVPGIPITAPLCNTWAITGSLARCSLDVISAKDGLNSTSVNLLVKVDSGALNTITNTVTVTSTEPEAEPNMYLNIANITTNITTKADLSVIKTPSFGLALLDEPLTYTISISNPGPSDAQMVTVVDTLSDKLQYSPSSGCIHSGEGFGGGCYLYPHQHQSGNNGYNQSCHLCPQLGYSPSYQYCHSLHPYPRNRFN